MNNKLEKVKTAMINAYKYNKPFKILVKGTRATLKEKPITAKMVLKYYNDLKFIK